MSVRPSVHRVLQRNHSEGLQKKCNALYDYSRFVGKVRRNKESGMEIRDMEAAENLLKANIDSETIAKCIGLPLEQVLHIKENLSVKA